MPHHLQAHLFNPSKDAAEVQAFSCGDQVWAIAASNWIKGDGAHTSMKKWGTRVWLYRLGTGELVGFGSLGIVKWTSMPPGAILAIIPQLAVQSQFQSQPTGVPPDEKFIHQIMNHLIGEAWADPTVNFVVLEVHQDHDKGIGLYRRHHFDLLPDSVTKTFGGTKHTYRRMARALRAPA